MDQYLIIYTLWVVVVLLLVPVIGGVEAEREVSYHRDNKHPLHTPILGELCMTGLIDGGDKEDTG